MKIKYYMEHRNQWNSDPKNQKMRLCGYCNETGNLLPTGLPPKQRLPPCDKNRMISPRFIYGERPCERKHVPCNTMLRRGFFNCATSCHKSREKKELNTSIKSARTKKFSCSRRNSSSSRSQSKMNLSEINQNIDFGENQRSTFYSDETEKQKNEISTNVLMLSVPPISRCRTMEILARARKDSISSESSYQPEPEPSMHSIFPVCKKLDFESDPDSIEFLAPNKMTQNNKLISKTEQTLPQKVVEPPSMGSSTYSKFEVQKKQLKNRDVKRSLDYFLSEVVSSVGDLSIESEAEKYPNILLQEFESSIGSSRWEEEKIDCSKKKSLVKKSEIDVGIFPQNLESDKKTLINEERESLIQYIIALKTENEYLRSNCSTSFHEKVSQTKDSN